MKSFLKMQDLFFVLIKVGNCTDKGAMKNFFDRLKIEKFFGEKFKNVDTFIKELRAYIDYYNNERISMKLNGMSPVQYRTHSQVI